MTTLFVLFAAMFMQTTSVNAAPPGTWFSEAELAQKYDEVIFPFWESMTTGTLNGKDGVRLNYKKYIAPNERGAIVLVSGYGQSHIQYAELLYGLAKLGYSLYIMDNRGLGFSQRLIPNAYKIYVGEFYDYVYDMKKFMDDVVRPSTHRRTIMLAHSMGGQIAILYQTMYPGELSAMVLNSPLVEMKAGPLNEAEAMLVASNAYGPAAKAYAFGQKDPDWNALTIDKQTMTHSQARFDVKVKAWRRFPETKMGGATFNWIYYTARASAWMRSHAPKKMNLPVLMLTADQEKLDTIVSVKRQTWLCQRIANCRQRFFPTSYHEILWERDDVRGNAIAEIEAFLDEQTR